MVKIIPNLFPANDYPIRTRNAQLDLMAVSMFALHFDVVGGGYQNLLQKDQINGVYFFRDFGVPVPRPSTFLAWEQICRIGNTSSPMVMLPFLPSMSADDEVGSALSIRGSHLPSLSSKSSLHVRDSRNMVIWGNVFIGDSDAGSLTHSVRRSDVTESMLVPPTHFESKTAQLSIRTRMEFLARFGFVQTNKSMLDMRVPRVWRLMFQFLKGDAAEHWIRAYSTAKKAVLADSNLIHSDFHDMMSAQAADSRLKEDAPKETRLKASERFANIDDFFS